jgi:RimJ/RimL family protein N-acetyltransferase
VIKVLQESDRDRTLAFLNLDHELNLIMIYDIKRFGLDNLGDFFQGEYYGVFRDGELGGVSVIYNFGSMFIYTPHDDLAPELVDFMAGLERKPRYLIGRAEWAGAVLDKLLEQGMRPHGMEIQEYMVLDRERFRPRHSPEARFADPGDLESVIRLHRYFQMEYFGSLDEVEEELARQAETRMADSGIAIAESGGQIVAKAEIMVRTDRAALIGGVYTAPLHRGKDLSFACMSLLCEGILKNMNKACLNVSTENPPAQHVYRSLGFEKLCDYRMVHFPG